MKKPYNLILHLHPAKVPERSLAFGHTFGLGGMLALLFVVQAVTGILLRFIYVPDPVAAYDSILSIKRDVFMGQFIRNMHHTAGMLMVVFALLHMMRVMFTEAFKPPRQSNWTIGLVLLLLVVFSNFSGYLLPWDQLSFWAVTVATSMLSYIPLIGDHILNLIRGGEEVGAVTLLNFYNFHTAILPIAMLVLMSFHFWKVRKAGGVVIPGGVDKKEVGMVPVYPNLVAREFVVALVLLAVIFFVAAVHDAPLLERANPAMSPNPAKAPWYFMGIQEMLMHFHPFFAAILIPITVMFLLFYLPYLKYGEDNAGVWFASHRGRYLSKYTAIIALVITPLLIISNELIPDLVDTASGLKPFLLSGVLPFVFMLGAFWLAIRFLRKKQYSLNEIVQALLVFMAVTYLVLMISGIWFRGEGMEICLPWQR